MKEIINYLQSEFVNTESFKDLENFIDWNTKTDYILLWDN
jgi:hypothetical protein